MMVTECPVYTLDLHTLESMYQAPIAMVTMFLLDSRSCGWGMMGTDIEYLVPWACTYYRIYQVE